jgi:hypothetical protein
MWQDSPEVDTYIKAEVHKGLLENISYEGTLGFTNVKQCHYVPNPWHSQSFPLTTKDLATTWKVAMKSDN